MKKGRHRRFEEAREFKRRTDFDADSLFAILQSESPNGAGLENSDDELSDEDEDDDYVEDER